MLAGTTVENKGKLILTSDMYILLYDVITNEILCMEMRTRLNLQISIQQRAVYEKEMMHRILDVYILEIRYRYQTTRGSSFSYKRTIRSYI